MKRYILIIAIIAIAVIGSAVFYACKKENDGSLNTEMSIQKDMSNFTRYYNAVFDASQKLLYYNIDTISEQNFVSLYKNLIINEFNVHQVPAISNYSSVSTAEIQLFQNLISLYAANESLSDKTLKMNNYIKTIEANPSIAKPVKERLYALTEMLKAVGCIDLSNLHKQLNIEGDSRAERRLHAAISDQLKDIFDNPISTAFFIAGLPGSFVEVVAVAVYKVLRGDYDHIQ
jgi:hypothetical protein